MTSLPVNSPPLTILSTGARAPSLPFICANSLPRTPVIFVSPPLIKSSSSTQASLDALLPDLQDYTSPFKAPPHSREQHRQMWHTHYHRYIPFSLFFITDHSLRHI